MESNGTYALFPSPVTRHEVLESMVVGLVIFLIGCIVKLILEVRIGQHIVDNHERVSEPDLVLSHHPIRNIMIWLSALLLDGKRFPLDIT